ncbi:MAG: carboxypeptidase M32 [Candidatus Diapherotrites archaeon]|nr:carboxypeptidase M32 [Candidatus Diapherotrites archaeon]
MRFENDAVREILREYRRAWALHHLRSLAEWDSDVVMPKGGASLRGEALAITANMLQDFYSSERIRDLVSQAERADLNDYEMGVVRVLRRTIHYYTALPSDLVAEEERVIEAAKRAWEEAKEKSDFSIFAPHLERIFEIQRKKAEFLGYEKHPYDALLDLYEEGLTCDDVDRMFSSVLPEVTRLLHKIMESAAYFEHHDLEEITYDRQAMEELNRLVLTEFGADWNHFRMDVSAHPFTIDLAGPHDVRITTWYQGKDFRRSLLAAVHEWGHALYELQQDPELCCTPVSGGVSLGIHESQSRFWENHIGRSRAFVDLFYDAMTASVPSLKAYDPNEVYLYFNMVRPELLRVEADEISYIPHIALRYDLEKALIEEKISVSELPQAWNEKMQQYLGVTPPDDAHGVLQDVHWALGSVGYFPTYAIGTILSAQIHHALERDLGKLDDLVAGKHFGAIRTWLGERVHQWGSIYSPKELVLRATGERMNAEYFVQWIREHYGKIYAGM